MQLQDRAILITGGTSGIGLALVKQLAPRNKQIVVIARNKQKLDALSRSYSNLAAYPCALDNPGELLENISRIRKTHPDISIVINNAAVQFNQGLTGKKNPDNTDEWNEKNNLDEIALEIATNLTAPITICALMVESLCALSEPTALVNIGSGLALFPKRDSAVYCATKAGLHNFSKSLGYQLEHTSIKVIDALLPLVDTPMTQGRTKQKLTAVDAATQIIDGIEQGKNRIYVGKTRWMPLIARISPSLMARIMKNA